MEQGHVEAAGPVSTEGCKYCNSSDGAHLNGRQDGCPYCGGLPPDGIDCVANQKDTFLDGDERWSPLYKRTGSVDPDSGKEHKPMFIDVDAMKEKIRQAAMKEEYDVANFYRDKGVWQHIARHQHFEKLTLGIIACNALWISIDTDNNKAQVLLEAAPPFQIIEHAFCVYFSFELFVRFMSFRVKRNGLRDAWFVFDSGLVFMMVVETWVMTSVMLLSGGVSAGGLGNASILRMARLLRLSRMARMARLFRAMPELLILVKGMVAACRSVFFTLCLLAIITYVFGIAFRQLVGDAVRDADGGFIFGTVPMAMHTLLLDGTLLDSTGSVVKALGDVSVVYAALFYLFILLAALTVMNMLIGVLCEVVSAVAATEKEISTVSFVKTQLQKVMHEGGLDKNADGLVSKEEFSKVLDYPEACRALEEVGVDVLGLVDNIDFIFADEAGEERKLDFGDFLQLVLKLRGTNTATVKDIVDLRKFINASHQRLREELRRPRRVSVACSAPLHGHWGGQMDSEGTCTIASSGLPPLQEKNRAATFSVGPLPSASKVSGWQAWQPEKCAPEESEMWDRRARLVDALVTAQAELQRFVEALPPSEFLSDVDLGLTLPGLVPSGDPRNSSGSPKAPVVLLDPFRAGWQPGELSDLHNKLRQLQQALTGGLGGLQRVRERLVRPVQRGDRTGGRTPLLL